MVKIEPEAKKDPRQSAAGLSTVEALSAGGVIVIALSFMCSLMCKHVLGFWLKCPKKGCLAYQCKAIFRKKTRLRSHIQQIIFAGSKPYLANIFRGLKAISIQN